MESAQFRELSSRMIDTICAYWQGIESRPPLSMAQPGDVLRALPLQAPEEGLGTTAASWDEIFGDIESIIMPGLTHWQHPNFYAFFSANTSVPAVLGELLSAGLGVQGMLWATSPACTELEQRMLNWLAIALDLPKHFLFDASAPTTTNSGGGVIEGTASESTLAALLAARQRLRMHGVDVKRATLKVYASTQAHSSVIKAAMIAGLADGPDDTSAIKLIPTDDQFRLDPQFLANAINADIAAGHVPCMVCATIGTTGVTAVDPIDAIAAAIASCKDLSVPLWLHVDAAHSGASLICPEFRWQSRGLECADSFAFNPHKWLLTNFDCGCLWVRERKWLTAALSITPEYLRNAASESGQVVDYRDWQIPLGRRFRALKLWFVMRHYGIQGLQAYIREHVRLAELFESLVRNDSRLAVLAPRTVNLVCFGYPDGDKARGSQLLNAINASGKAYLTHTVIPATSNHPARFALRMAISGTFTQERHVRETWELIKSLV